PRSRGRRRRRDCRASRLRPPPPLISRSRLTAESAETAEKSLALRSKRSRRLIVDSAHAIIDPVLRAARLARALWILWAVLLWNVVFDHVIVVAGRSYVAAAARAAASTGAAPTNLDD